MATAEATETKRAEEVLGTGRRKTSVARVRIRPGSGNITINKRPLEEYFLNDADRRAVLAPLDDTSQRETVDIVIRVGGGGTTGQSGACRMGIARALVKMDESLHDVLREKGHMTRDARMVERKKYGLHGARRGTQFSKR